MPQCCAFGCSFPAKKGGKLYRLPSELRNAARRRVWLMKISRENWEPTSDARLCANHFTPDQFETKRADGLVKLKPNAVPTIFCHRKPPVVRKAPAERKCVFKTCPKETEVSIDYYETIWIKKEEPDEVPKEPGSVFIEEPVFIKEEPEVILEVDETKNIVVSSTIHETDSTRVIKNSESCGISVEEPVNQGVVHEDLEKVTQESGYGTRSQGLTSQEDAAFRTGLQCSLRKEEFQTFSCSSCLQSFPSKYRLIMHVFIHIEGVQPPAHVCKSCGEVFASNNSLNKHMEMSESHKDLFDGNSDEFDCGEDHKNILEADDVLVKQDTMTHGREERYRHDNYRTSSTTDYVSDQAVQLTAPRLHKCDICDMSFVWLSLLKRHKLKHTGLKPHKCDLCGKSFSQLATLKRHAVGHTGVKPHKCGICGKCFTQPRHLKNHTLIHTGIKPHKCDTCGKCFTELVTLKKHGLIHTGVRPHKCDFCGKSFTQSSSLNRHKLIHLGIYPYKCDFCGHAFTQLDHLKTHALKHTGARPHTCNVCSKSFSLLSTLKRHALKLHFS